MRTIWRMTAIVRWESPRHHTMPRLTQLKTCCTTCPVANLRPTSAEVCLDNLRGNFQAIQKFVGPTITVCAVIKADAYGHGLVDCASALESAGAGWFGVTSTEEGIRLRDAGIRSQILVMTGFWRGDEKEIIARTLVPIVWEPWHFQLLHRVARMERRRTVRIHLKVDTGMGRLGAKPRDISGVIDTLRLHPELQLDGISTHLASAEVVGGAEVNAQLKCFGRVAAQLRRAGFSPRHMHAANSAAVVSCAKSWNNMVRPGISLYGYHLPFTGAQQPNSPNVTPVLSWKTRIISIQRVQAGKALGYNGTYITSRSSVIAILPVGYADGLNRRLSSRGRVIIRGKYAPIVGRVSMDITLIDVTSVPGADVGDEVILLGTNRDLMITAAEHAIVSATIPHEILCNISKRVPRRYLERPVETGMFRPHQIG